MKPKNICISVVIPCYNVESFLAECLDSVLCQTFQSTEIICVEDCSADKTPDILRKYEKKYKNIRIIYNKKNQGLAISRNIGMDAAKGEYIYFLDSDDTISRSCLQDLYDKMVKDNCDIVMGAIKPYTRDTDDENCVKQTQSLTNWVKFNPFAKLQITEQNGSYYYWKLYCCAVNKLYKTRFLKDNNIRFINKNCMHEDNGFWLKILSCKPCVSGIKTTSYFYRIRPKSITTDANSNKKLHNLHYEINLGDALIFAKNNKPLSRFIYYERYTLKKHPLFYFVWYELEKRLRILSFTIFGLIYNYEKKQYKLKVLGIPLLKWGKK